MDDIVKNLGPLAALAGEWEGDTGDDVAPSDDRGVENNKYREKMVFVPFGPTDNHEQKLWGLRYSTTAWRLGEPDPFHEELGYWLWDPREKQVMRCFLVPRGVALIAGGTAEASARELQLSAKLGSSTYGICSNPFLDREFKTVAYELTIKILDANRFQYSEDTQLIIKDKKEIFHHRDSNVMKKINS